MRTRPARFVDEVAQEDSVIEAAKKQTGENPSGLSATFVLCATGASLITAYFAPAIYHFVSRIP